MNKSYGKEQIKLRDFEMFDDVVDINSCKCMLYLFRNLFLLNRRDYDALELNQNRMIFHFYYKDHYNTHTMYFVRMPWCLYINIIFDLHLV